MGLFEEIASEIADEIVAEAVGRSMAEEGAPTLEGGVPGRAEVLGITPSGTTITIGDDLEMRVCTFQLRIILDGQAPFDVTVTQRAPEVYLPQLMGPATALAVRVDPDDHSRVAIDFDRQAPVVRMPESTGPGSAADILANGAEVTVVVQGYAPMGILNHAGEPVYVLTLEVTSGTQKPYEVQVGNVVPDSARSLLTSGARLHARVGATPGEVVVDWARGAVAGS